MNSMVCLYFGPADECRNCGGWTKAAGGPFEGDSRFCSEDCYADDQDRQARVAAREAWCPVCGYDRGEHGPDCGARAPIPGGPPMREGNNPRTGIAWNE